MSLRVKRLSHNRTEKKAFSLFRSMCCWVKPATVPGRTLLRPLDEVACKKKRGVRKKNTDALLLDQRYSWKCHGVALPQWYGCSPAIMGHFKATSLLPPCQGVIHFIWLSKWNCCQPTPLGCTPLFIFKHETHMAACHPHPAWGILHSLTFSSYSDCSGYYTVSSVSKLWCNRGFWSMKVASCPGSLLR